jgi:hypothetical protein
MACQLQKTSLLYQSPGFLWHQVIIQAQEIKEITRTPPRVAIPMLVTSAKDLKAWSHITSIMVFLACQMNRLPRLDIHTLLTLDRHVQTASLYHRSRHRYSLDLLTDPGTTLLNCASNWHQLPPA